MPCDAPVTITTRCALAMRGPYVGARPAGRRLVVEILFQAPEESTSRNSVSSWRQNWSLREDRCAATLGGQRTYGEKNHEDCDFDGSLGRRCTVDFRRGEGRAARCPAGRCSLSAGCDSRQ